MDAIWQQSTAESNGSNRKLVFDYGTYGYPLKRSFGVSVYFPCVDEIPKCYPSLKFCEETRWHEFLGAFLRSPKGAVAVGERVAAPKDKDVLEADIVVSPHGEPVFVSADHAAVVATGLEVTGGSTANTGGSTSGNNGDVKTTHGDPIKTTYGDVIKTTLGDPIKKPELPSWILPTALSAPPIRSRTVVRKSPAPVRTKTEPTGTCGCGQKPQG